MANPYFYFQGTKKIQLLLFYSKRFRSTNVSPQFNNIKSKIKMSGPITVADYMKELLTSPTSGYYMTRDVFGKEGDFITSPEVSQLFGEMIALWSINEWQKLGFPSPLNLVELGPGRGTMLEDILRVFRKLNFHKYVEVHLVEISPELSRLQADRLCQNCEECPNELYYRKGLTKDSQKIHWYKSFHDIPRAFSCVFAHEFFDALPIHKFQRTEEGWREVLIDLDPLQEDSLRYVMSRMPTPASAVFTKREDKRDHLEICPQAEVIMGDLATRLEEHGGFALIADYGHDGEKSDTFRGFRGHKLHDPLVDPSTADLTADVDFSYLRNAVSDKLVTIGPIDQHDFLKNMQIDVRLKILLENSKGEESRKNLETGYRMLVDKDKMGERFKFMALFPAVLKEFLKHKPVVGFTALTR